MIIENGSTPTVVFLLVDAADFVSPVVGAQPAVTLSKSGGAFVSSTESVVEIGHGWYHVVLTATETDTDGPLIVRASADGTSEWRDILQVYSSFTMTVLDGLFDRIADHVLRRNFAAAATSDFGDLKDFRSLLGAVAKDVNRVELNGSKLSIYESDDQTVLGTQSVVSSANPSQITSVDTDG